MEITAKYINEDNQVHNGTEIQLNTVLPCNLYNLNADFIFTGKQFEAYS